MASVKTRVEKLKARKTDRDTGQLVLREVKLAKAIITTDKSEDAIEYIKESMAPVDKKYTDQTYEECDRVKSQLAEEFKTQEIGISFDYQGSVTNDTHIRFYSDIDLLALTEKYIGIKRPLENVSPYKGNPIEDLIQIRKVAIARLKSSYPQATVDDSGSKSIAIYGGSLRRKIDVVPSNWVDTHDYRTTSNKIHRGIEILDAKVPARVENFPFLHNYLLTERDNYCGGNLKRLIRFFKSVREDSDKDIEINSYNLTGLCYAMPVEKIRGQADLQVIYNFVQFSLQVAGDESLRNSLLVPNGQRKLFDESFSLTELGKINSEAFSLIKIALGIT